MFTLQAIEQALTVITILFVLCGLWLCISILWILASGEVDEYRRAYREWMLRKWLEEIGRSKRDHRVEAYIEGLRGLAEDE